MGFDPLVFSKARLIGFVTDMITLGTNPSTLNVWKSSISSLFDAVEEDSVLSRLMKVNRNNRNPPSFKDSFDLTALVRYLKKLDNRTASFTCLRDKVITLLAICGLFRASDLAHILADKILIRDQLFIYLARTKSSNTFKGLPVILNKFNTDQNICPVASTRTFLTRFTHSGRGYLFQDGRGNNLTPNSIGRILKSSLEKAGVNTKIFTGHSIRRTAASYLLDLDVSVEEVMRLGRWVSESVFVKFYARSRKERGKINHLLDLQTLSTDE